MNYEVNLVDQSSVVPLLCFLYFFIIILFAYLFLTLLLLKRDRTSGLPAVIINEL